MAIPRFTRGDTRPTLTWQFRDESGAVLDLAGGDKVYCRLAPRGGSSPVLVKEGVVDAAADRASVTLADGDLELPAGAYEFTGELDAGGAGAAIQNTYRVDLVIDDVLAFNMLTNTGFENDAGGAPAGWSTAPAAGGTIGVVTENRRFGAKSLKFLIPNQGANVASYAVQDVALIPRFVTGDKVTVSAYVLATALEAGMIGCGVKAEQSLNGGTTFAIIGQSAYSATTGQWQRLTATGTVSAAATHLRITVELLGGGTVYWDAAQLETGPRATPYREVA